ncbi:MAG TPA: AraC family transcriptional regulator [Micromonosporaceae bacterium]|nr:AraC family transcriptional regulator [Micromonosporaceae bacterium]
MDDIVKQAVERAIETMRGNLGERLTIDDIARSAMFSKFHFSRVFQRATGVSPGRFLSAMRLEEAKRLLVSTSFTVADISHRVGYNSVGTFSSRFRSSVGVSPTTYRQYRGTMTRIPLDERPFPRARSTVRGHVLAPPEGELGLVFVGLFPSRILQAPPVRCAVLERPGPFALPDVPLGTWHLMAHSVAPGTEDTIDAATYVGCNGPLTIHPDVVAKLADVQLRPMQSLDPPVLMALLDLRSAKLGLSGTTTPDSIAS